MKVFVATTDGQGERPSDFSWTVDGELMSVPVECDNDRDNVDGGCGCRRSMAGMGSSMATTTFSVANKSMTAPSMSGS